MTHSRYMAAREGRRRRSTEGKGHLRWTPPPRPPEAHSESARNRAGPRPGPSTRPCRLSLEAAPRRTRPPTKTPPRPSAARAGAMGGRAGAVLRPSRARGPSRRPQRPGLRARPGCRLGRGREVGARRQLQIRFRFGCPGNMPTPVLRPERGLRRCVGGLWAAASPGASGNTVRTV